jgi:zinc transport system permease protein
MEQLVSDAAILAAGGFIVVTAIAVYLASIPVSGFSVTAISTHG